MILLSRLQSTVISHSLAHQKPKISFIILEKTNLYSIILISIVYTKQILSFHRPNPFPERFGSDRTHPVTGAKSVEGPYRQLKLYLQALDFQRKECKTKHTTNGTHPAGPHNPNLVTVASTQWTMTQLVRPESRAFSSFRYSGWLLCPL